jgi:hypothetical protein
MSSAPGFETTRPVVLQNLDLTIPVPVPALNEAATSDPSALNDGPQVPGRPLPRRRNGCHAEASQTFRLWSSPVVASRTCQAERDVVHVAFVSGK